MGVIQTTLGAAVKFIDINKDGYDDLFIGAPETIKSSQRLDTTGWTHVIYGKSSGSSYPTPFNVTSLDGTNGFTLGGGAEDEYFGQSIASADINNDSFQDAIITGNDRSYVLYGKSTAFPSYLNVTDIDGTNGFKITGLKAHKVNVADLDQDGVQDILLSQQFTINVIFGNSTFPMELPISSLNDMNGFATTAGSGPIRVSATAGDLNQDGYPDLLIGTTSNIAPGKFSAVFSHARPYPAIVNSLSLNGTNGTNFLGLANVDYVGYAASSGYMGSQFVTITASPIASNFAGRVFGIYGSTKPFPASLSIADMSTNCKGFIIEGIASTQVGATITMADVNNDGLNDLMIRAASNKAYVVYGKLPQAQTLNLALTSATYTENNLPLTLDSGLALAAGDCDYITTATVTITNVQAGDVLAMSPQPNIVATYDAGTGTLTLNGTRLASEYQTALRSVTFSNPSDAIEPTPRTITFAGINPIDETISANMTLNIASVNDLPVLTGSGTALDYISNQALIIDDGITLSDVDNINVVSAEISISSGFVNGDVLSFIDQNGIVGQYDSNTGILTLTGSASLANYQAALRSVTYQNANSAAVSNREISFLVNDGADDSNVITRPINVIPLYNLLSGINDELICFNQNESEKFIVPQVSILGGNALTLESATVTVSDPVTAEDVLEFAELGNGITGNYDSNTGVLTLTGPALASDFEATLRAVKYKNNNDVTNSSAKTFTVAVDYDGLPSNTLQSEIVLITVNDAPIVINPVEDFNVTVNEPFSMVLSDNAFSQPVSELSLAVTENGSELTSLNFDASTRTLSGSLAVVGENRFSFFASDRCNQTTTSNFTVNALPAPISAPLVGEVNVTPPTQDNTAAIAGGVVGGLLGLGGIGLLAGLMYRRRKHKKDDDTNKVVPATVETADLDNEVTVRDNPIYEKKQHSWYNRLYVSMRNLISGKTSVTTLPVVNQPEEELVEQAVSSHAAHDNSTQSSEISRSSAKSASSSEKSFESSRNKSDSEFTGNSAAPSSQKSGSHSETSSAGSEESEEDSESSSLSSYTP